MMKFEDFIAESLAAEVKSEPRSNASAQARKLGLTYMGFGRYADNKGQLAYTVDNDRLIPYKKRDEVQSMYAKTVTAAPAPKTKAPVKGKPQDKSKGSTQKVDKAKEAEFYNAALNRRDREDTKILKTKNKEALAVNKELSKAYSPGMFDENEYNAIAAYASSSNDTAAVVNRYLYKGFDEGTDPNTAAQIEDLVTNLDSAFQETQAPFPYTVYAGLSGRYNPESFMQKGEYIFRGYVSASLNYSMALGDSGEGGTILQIELSQGQKSIYLDSLGVNAGEMEVMLPRGSKIKLISGPHALDDSLVSENPQGNMVSLFHCQLVEDL
jgi:hypothetical protein